MLTAIASMMLSLSDDATMTFTMSLHETCPKYNHRRAPLFQILVQALVILGDGFLLFCFFLLFRGSTILT